MLMAFHTLDNIRQAGNGFYDVWPFIEHDAFGPFAHGGIGDFSPGRNACLDKVFQNLCSPDDGNMGSFTNPEYFFLQLCQTMISRFNGQIAPGNHDAKGIPGSGLDDDFWKIVYTVSGFYFCDDSHVPCFISHPFV